MKRFLKENYALIAGVTLPLILMILFFLAGAVSRASVPDPEYDALFVANYYNINNNSYKIRIEDGKLVISYKPADGRGPVGFDYPAKPELYIFDHATLKSRPFVIDYTPSADGRIMDSALDNLNKNKMLDSPVSPDGYTFSTDYDYNSGLFSDMFGFGRNRAAGVLRKDGRNILIKNSPYYYGASFVAWIDRTGT